MIDSPAKSQDISFQVYVYVFILPLPSPFNSLSHKWERIYFVPPKESDSG